MITGDNPLTACHVGRELHFTKKSSTLILTKNNDQWLWESVDQTTNLPILSDNEINEEAKYGKEIWRNYSLCITGEVKESYYRRSLNNFFIHHSFSVNYHIYFYIIIQGLNYLKENRKVLLYKLLPHIAIFARFAPKQKEFVIIALQELGYTTLMCGDGTNDVGALKHAQVGK